MLELPHTIVGATLATKIGNPLLSLPLAFLSNFLLDILPHWNPHLYTELNGRGVISLKSKLIIIVDATLALVIGSLLAIRFYPDFSKVVLILAGCFFAVISDVLEAPYFFLSWKNKHILKLIGLQRKLQWNVPFLPGIISQISLILLCLFLIFS